MVYSPNSKIGELSEHMAKEPFLRAGYLIYAKAAPGPVDFIAMHPETGEICKVEVKTIKNGYRPSLGFLQAVCSDLVALVEHTQGTVDLVLPTETRCVVCSSR